MPCSICLPASPPIDIGPYLPIIEHPLFQRLRFRKQLGLNDLVFPGAQHTRFEHALGVLALTGRLCTIQGLSGADRHLLEAFALLHDIGHGPFSHQVEPIIGGSHHQRGLECLEEMSPALESCGLTSRDLQDMMTGANPLSIWVSDRNLGTDKLDYLHRDALHIGFSGVPDIERLQHATRMSESCLAIDGKYMEDAKQLQKFYSYLHQHGYLNKTALTAQRMLQRAVYDELVASRTSPEVLWPMTDRQLLNWLDQAQTGTTRALTTRLADRNLHRCFLTLKPRGYGFVENSAGKDLAVKEWPLADLRRLSQRFQDNACLRHLEDTLADAYHLQAGAVLIAAMPYYTKLIPRDLRVQFGDGDSFWLLEKDTDHFRSLESDYQRTFAIRLLAIPEARQQLAAQADAILISILK